MCRTGVRSVHGVISSTGSKPAVTIRSAEASRSHRTWPQAMSRTPARAGGWSSRIPPWRSRDHAGAETVRPPDHRRRRAGLHRADPGEEHRPPGRGEHRAGLGPVVNTVARPRRRSSRRAASASVALPAHVGRQVRCTAPGRSSVATAAPGHGASPPRGRSVRPTGDRRVQPVVVDDLVGEVSLRPVSICPDNAMTGTRSRVAEATPFASAVDPGPSVVGHGLTPPVAITRPSAMNAAVASRRASTTSMSSTRQASSRSTIVSPG